MNEAEHKGNRYFSVCKICYPGLIQVCLFSDPENDLNIEFKRV